MTEATWQVYKFGGTSLADAMRIAHAADLATDAIRGPRQSSQRIGVVVSAMAKTTNGLLAACEQASDPAGDYAATLADLEARTVTTCETLLLDQAAPVVERIRQDFRDLEDVLRGVRVGGVCPPSTSELVSGYGELWSAQMMQGLLARRGEKAVWLDARDVLVVDHEETGPAVRWEVARQKLDAWLAASDATRDATHVIITGFIARDGDGVPTTLRRNGSDYTASIFGRLFDAAAITIWTDVDGVMSADPRLVPEAKVLPALTYSEAMELAYFGAEILHPQTMAPAVQQGIPLHIKNAGQPDHPGTEISNVVEHGATRRTKARAAVKGFSSVKDVALLSLEGAGMIGVPGVASRMFFALREVGVSVVMISQASSEHTVCVAIPSHQADAAERAVTQAFASELAHGQVQRVDVSGPYCILAAVGDNMVETRGVSGRFFSALGRAGVNVRAIAQGASERNISAVIAAEDSARALRAVHAGFYLSEQTLSVGLIGPGQVGAELLAQFEAQKDELRARFRCDLAVRGIASSSRMLLDDGGVDLMRWRDDFAAKGQPLDLDAFAAHVHADHLPHAVILDCTASESVAAHYARWLEAGIHVITPNKKANTAALESYQRLRELGSRLTTHYHYEATVGAGLPVITTLRDLLATGDRIHRIEGVLSGSLSFLLGELAADRPFSAIVKEARDRGYTEPHPRDDLSGMDVARKAVILGREIGLRLELDDLEVTSLVPEALRDCDDPDAFTAQLSMADADIETQRAAAESRGEVLRYVAVIEADGKVEVGLRAFAADSPMGRVRDGNNILVFTTDRYAEQPLIVQGPGAGPAVTAAGVFGDLLRLVASLGGER